MLMDLHIGYEAVEPWKLKRIESDPSPQPSPRKRGEGASVRGAGVMGKADAPKAMLKADSDAGTIILDSQTTLSGIPPEAWDYKLGNSSALEWILDQHRTRRSARSSTPTASPTTKVIDLLMRVTSVSVETHRITEAMRTAKRQATRAFRQSFQE